MALPPDILTREYLKFLETSDGEVAVRVATDNFLFEVSRGAIPGFSTREVFGRNADVGLDNPFEDIWQEGGIYQFPTSAATVDVVSDNTNDTGAGTGAQQVTIEYLDASYVTNFEVVTLNGTTPVTTTNSMFRINGMVVTAAGSSGGAVGTIKASQGSNVLARIDSVFNNTLQAIYTVPVNTAAYLVAGTGQISIGNRGIGLKAGEIVISSREFGKPGVATVIASLQTDGTGTFGLNLPAPVRFPPRADVRGLVIPQQSGLTISLFASLILEDIS